MRPDRFGTTKGFSSTKFLGFTEIFLALFFAGSTAHPPAAAAAAAPDVPSYDSASFGRHLQALKANLDSAGQSADSLRALRETLPKSWPVDVQGRHFEVPTASLVSHLDQAEKRPENREHELDQARAYLDSLAEEASSFSGASPSGSNAARSKLDAILARSEYAHVRQQNWHEKLRQRINEFFLNLLARIFRGVGSQKTFGYILLWLGVAGAAIVIAYLVFHTWFRAARTAEIELTGAAVPARSWREWVFAGRESATRGDYRTAVHCAYWAAIARLQDLGALSPDRSKTPREFLRALAGGKPILAEEAAVRSRALAHMTSRLENTWYGYQLATEADFRDSLAQLETLGCHLP